MSADQIGFGLLYLGVFLLIGKWIRIRVKWMQKLFLPSSVIGGFLALLFGPQVLGRLLEPVVGKDSFWFDCIFPSVLFFFCDSVVCIVFGFLYLGVVFLFGKCIRIRVIWMQKLFLPSSVIGGFLALLFGPQVLGRLLEPVVGKDSFWSDGIIPSDIIDVWDPLAGIMISVVFATLFLGSVLPSMKKVWDVGGPQLAFGWSLGWGQYVVGLLLSILVLTPFFGMPPFVGALI